MRFKIKFTEFVEGTQNCEAIVEAGTRDEAIQKLFNKELTSYLVVSREFKQEIVEDMVREIIEVGK